MVGAEVAAIVLDGRAATLEVEELEDQNQGCCRVSLELNRPHKEASRCRDSDSELEGRPE